MTEISEKIYDKAVKLLSVRLHTTGELYRKLKARGFAAAEIEPVLRKLEEQKFLDDGRFAEIFVDNFKRYKDWGYYGIKAKLLGRQIPSDIAAAALAEFFLVEDELQVGSRLVKKLKKQGRTDFAKLMASLQGKGFRSEVIRKILVK